MADCSCWTNSCTAACNYGSCAYHQCQSSCQGGCGGGCRGCGGCDGSCSGGCGGACKNECKTLCNTSCSNSTATSLANLVLQELITGSDMSNVQKLLLQEVSRRPSVSSLPHSPTFSGTATYSSINQLIANLKAIGKTVTASNISEAGAIIYRTLGEQIISLANAAAKEKVAIS